MADMGKLGPDDELNCGACGYDTCRAHAAAIVRGLAEDAMCLPYTIDRLKNTVQKLDLSNTKLASAQQALVQAEKLASMGQLSAGIAHEVNNPLGVVLLYAHLLLESYERESPQAKDLAMIVEQADRCKQIVSGLLNFARQNKVVLLPTNLAELAASALRGVHTPAGIEVVKQNQDASASADLDADQIRQVLTNLLTNAVAALPSGGRLCVRTGFNNEQAWFEVEDSGVGIPKENINRIFEPFFTTKQMGRGTGLGLAVSYGIVKMHRGAIKVKSNADRATGQFPRDGREPRRRLVTMCSGPRTKGIWDQARPIYQPAFIRAPKPAGLPRAESAGSAGRAASREGMGTLRGFPSR
jgi:two-component system NtrC family sensor kinase